MCDIIMTKTSAPDSCLARLHNVFIFWSILQAVCSLFCKGSFDVSGVVRGVGVWHDISIVMFSRHWVGVDCGVDGHTGEWKSGHGRWRAESHVLIFKICDSSVQCLITNWELGFIWRSWRVHYPLPGQFSATTLKSFLASSLRGATKSAHHP